MISPSYLRPFNFFSRMFHQKIRRASNTPQKVEALAIKSISNLKEQWPRVSSNIKRHGFACLDFEDSTVNTLQAVASFLGHNQKHARNTLSGICEIKDGYELSTNEKIGTVATNIEFFPHTDGTYINGIGSNSNRYYRVGPPKFILLQCVKNALEGGESLIVDAKMILEKIIQEDQLLIPLLFSPDVISIMRGNYLVMDVPIFKKEPNGNYSIRFSYDRDIFFKKEHMFLIDYFNKNYIENPIYTSKQKLEAGQVLIIDNQRALHSRTSFVGERFLRRLWIHNENNSLELFQPNQMDNLYYEPDTSDSPLDKYEKFNQLPSKIRPEASSFRSGIVLDDEMERALQKLLKAPFD